jgi:hypothetical protein
MSFGFFLWDAVEAADAMEASLASRVMGRTVDRTGAATLAPLPRVATKCANDKRRLGLGSFVLVVVVLLRAARAALGVVAKVEGGAADKWGKGRLVACCSMTRAAWRHLARMESNLS